MEDEKLKNRIKEIKKIKMTEVEKQRVFYNIFNTTDKKEELVRSSWGIYAFVSLVKRHQLAYFVVIPLIIILSGGGVVFASQDSLPNDILYPIKVKILEPVEGALTFSQKEKAKHQSKLATTRLIEAQTLAKEKKLDVSTEEKINKLLVSHTVALDNAISKATKIDSKKEIDEITTNFRAEMNANARILEIINEKERGDEEYDDVKIMAKEIENENEKEDNNLSQTARTSAMSIKDTSKEEKIENKDYYKEKKEKLKLLIEDVDKSKNVGETEEVVSGEKIIDDTQNKIDEAKKYLEEADKKEIEGDENGSYSLLLDSESLLKEAEILIKSEVDFEEEEQKERENDY